ncbi:MAG: malate synthase A [Alphaproteobacteria bacterium]|nr:malate synthase A [Alphaproteobacteria bacterium]
MTQASTKPQIPGLDIKGAWRPGYERVLTPEALGLLVELHRAFDKRRLALLAARQARQARIDKGELPDFLPETRSVREGDWKVAPIPPALQDRRVEITGPTDRKMMINALNSGAKAFMTDFEDALAPTWANLIDGQINLLDLGEGRLEMTDPESGKHYKLNKEIATLIVRPRGWHLPEAHVTVDGETVSGSLFDFALAFANNAKKYLSLGFGPYYYLPKMESHKEVALWNEVFVLAQKKLGLPVGTIKATILIETLPAAFEMEEFLHAMKDHIAGLNCGRWDYIFSYIKRLRNRPEFLLPDRSQVVMGKAFLGAYSLLLIKTCHKRGAFAMGGMAAQIPVKGDEKANEAAFAKVRADKEREAGDGHDGTWVAHPGLVPVAQEVFDRLMPGPNQVARQRQDVHVTQGDMLKVHEGVRTEAGLRDAIRVGVQYIEAWLGGRGAVPLYNLMEDAATAEICRSQVWQWIHYNADLADGRKVTAELFEELLADEMAKLEDTLGTERFGGGHFAAAIALFQEMSTADEFEEFLTLPAYEALVARGE